MRLRDWAAAELGLWPEAGCDHPTLEARLAAWARQHVTVFLFHLKDGRATFDDKSGWHPSIRDEPLYPSMMHRAGYYSQFFSDALTRFGVTGEGVIAVDLSDLHDHEPDLPVFAFQRRHGSRFMLIPDIDFMMYDFYVDDRYRDAIEADDKAAGAIFVGSTTGSAIDAETVRTLDHERLRSAVFFKDHGEVVFDLPAIVQYDGSETLRLVENLGVAGRRWTWQEQLAYRYILSMDGNGATCSRMLLALASNSVPVKYDSNHELYYFRGLRPYRHYFPVSRDHDVLAMLRSGDTVLHDAIARESRHFCRSLLSRIHVMRYTAELLGGYLRRFGSGGTAIAVPADARIDTFVHRANIGTQWLQPVAWPDRSANPIEGFGLVAGEELAPEDLVYAAVDRDGRVSAVVEAGDYCGTRGLSRPLHGLSVALRGDAAARYAIAVAALFADGTMLDGAGGSALHHPHAPLIDLRITVTPRAGAGRSSSVA